MSHQVEHKVDDWRSFKYLGGQRNKDKTITQASVFMPTGYPVSALLRGYKCLIRESVKQAVPE